MITRLHRDMADMLSTASPMVSMGASSSGFHSQGRSEEMPRTLSDSEDDYLDDPALGELRDSLRSSTERFFIRRASKTPAIGRRRASEISPDLVTRADRSFVYMNNVHHSSMNLGRRNQTTVNGWEKNMGSLMGRSISKSTSRSPGQEQELGGEQREQSPTRVEEGFIVRNLSGSARMGTLAYGDSDHVGERIDQGGDGGGGSDIDDGASGLSCMTDRSILYGHPRVNRELFMPPSGDSVYTPSPEGTTTPTNLTSRSTRVGAGGSADIGMVAGEVETPRTRGSRVKTILTDVWARSEDTGRILEALKRVLVEEMASASTTLNHVRRTSAERLWPQPPRRGHSESMGGLSSSSGEKRVQLILLALDNIEQITAQLSQLLQEDSNRIAKNSSLPSQFSGERERHHWQRRRPRPVSLLPEEPQALPRKSSALLLRRRSAQGQVEPISCGVPRYRIQVGRLADDVYYEVTITQARSMWTVERRLDEFVTLRRALVATASEQAAATAAAAAAGKRQRGSSGDALPTGGRSGDGKGINRRADDDAILEGERRVPRLAVRGSGWLENSSLGMIMSGRKRQEVLAERQVLLASWLANVLADPELMSADLVHFLGGSDGGVLAQPVIAECFGGEADETDGVEHESEFTEFDENGDWLSSVVEVTLDSRCGGGSGDAGPNGDGIINDPVAKSGKLATVRRSSPLRTTRLIPVVGQRERHGSEVVVDSDDAQQGGELGQAQRNWRFGDEEDGVGTAMFVENTSPVLSVGSIQAHEPAPSPSSKLSTPPRQLSVDAFFRAPT